MQPRSGSGSEKMSDLTRHEDRSPEVNDGETTGGLQAKPGGVPVTAAAFAELEIDSAMWLNVEMWPTETLQCELGAGS